MASQIASRHSGVVLPSDYIRNLRPRAERVENQTPNPRVQLISATTAVDASQPGTTSFQPVDLPKAVV